MFAHERVTERDGSQWVNAEAYDELLAALRETLPSLHGLVEQHCEEPDVAAQDIRVRDLVMAAIAKAEESGA